MDRDHRDLLLEMCFDTEVSLVDLAWSLLDDVERYQLVAQTAIDAVAAEARRNRDLTIERDRLRDETRRLREALFMRERGDDDEASA